MTYVAHPYRPRLGLSRWRDLIGFSYWSWAGSLASILRDRTEPFILGGPFGSAGLGLYMLATEVATLPASEFVSPASTVLFAAFSEAQKKGTDTLGMTMEVILTLTMVVAPFTLGISATAWYIVVIALGAKWTAAGPLIAIAAWTNLFSVVGHVVWPVLSAMGRMRYIFVVSAGFALARCAVIYLAAMAGDIAVVAIASVGFAAAEAAIYVGLLWARGELALTGAGGALLRIAVALVVVGLGLHASGLAWQAIDMPVWLALLQGGGLGLFTVLACAVVQAALWWLAGRPAGPEARLIDACAPFLAHRWLQMFGR